MSTIARLSGYIFATKACIDNRKKLLSSNISSRCPCNMVNFGPVTAEIDWRVWGTPSYFNGYRVLAALLHGSLVVDVSQTFAALNRGRHLCSAGRPSRWALVHILVFLCFMYCLWPRYGIGQAIILLPCGFFLSSSFFFPRLAAADWMSTILLHMVWP